MVSERLIIAQLFEFRCDEKPGQSLLYRNIALSVCDVLNLSDACSFLRNKQHREGERAASIFGKAPPACKFNWRHSWN